MNNVTKIGRVNVGRYHEAEAEFKATFSYPLKKFMDITTLRGMVLGFDIVAFDECLRVPEGTSTSDFINKKYGPQAVKLVEGLL